MMAQKRKEAHQPRRLGRGVGRFLKRIFSLSLLHARAHKSKANLFITESDQLKR